MNNDNGIYYFIGNVTSHILHALPLYQELGGTFVVLSKKARRKIEKLYGIPVIAIDNAPYQWHRFGYKVKPVHEYSEITKRHQNTIRFLNRHARVVLFYDLFDFRQSPLQLTPPTVFLTHGNMLKDYMGENNRIEKMKHYTYMAALGPHLKEKFIQKGIPKTKLINIGIARTDDVIAHKNQVTISESITKLLHHHHHSLPPIISYIPTFWGASSIYTTGLEILRNFPDTYILLFRPHPHTPHKILKQYLKLIKNRPNIYYVPERGVNAVHLIDLFNASSVIVGDVSSVMLEAILTRKPLIFAYDTDKHIQSGAEYASIKDIISHSMSITLSDTPKTADIITQSLASSPDPLIWQKVIDNNFYHANGTSVQSIADFIRSITK